MSRQQPTDWEDVSDWEDVGMEGVQSGSSTTAVPQPIDERTAGQVATDQYTNVLKGIANAPKAMFYDSPKALGERVGQAVSSPQEMLKTVGTGGLNITGPMLYNTIKSMIYDPMKRVGEGVGELISPGSAPSNVANPSSPEWEQAAQGAGTQFGMAMTPAVLGRATEGANTSINNLESRIRASGERSTVRGLAGDNATNVANLTPFRSEMMAERIGRLRETAQEVNILQQKSNAGQLVKATADAVPLGKMVNRDRILDSLGKMIESKKMPNGIDLDPAAITATTEIYNEVAKFNDQIPFKDLHRYMQGKDHALDAAGKWESSGANAAAQRRALQPVRAARAEAGGPELVKANKQFELYSEMADAIELKRPELQNLPLEQQIKVAGSKPYLRETVNTSPRNTSTLTHRITGPLIDTAEASFQRLRGNAGGRLADTIKRLSNRKDPVVPPTEPRYTTFDDTPSLTHYGKPAPKLGTQPLGDVLSGPSMSPAPLVNSFGKPQGVTPNQPGLMDPAPVPPSSYMELIKTYLERNR